MNTFGTATQQVALLDPRDSREYRARFERDSIRELELANSLYVPIGRQPARGWILLRRADYDAVTVKGKYSVTFQMHVDCFDSAAPELVFKNLAIVQARCVTAGRVNVYDPDAVYLVELTDKRGVLANKWFAQGANSYYNVLSPAYPSNYYGTATWTWSAMVGDLWAQMSPSLGTYPGLPSAPSSAPTNWNLAGVPLWSSLCDALDHLGLAVSVDLTKDASYGVVSTGAADPAFDALTSKYSNRLEDDWNWLDTGSGRVPGTVVVYFRRANQFYGTEETIRRDSLQWATGAVYSVSVPAPSFFSGALGIHSLWDDFTVRFDHDGNILAADAATAATVAAERVSQYFDNVYSRTSGFMNRTYSGVLPFYAGSQVDGVCWKQQMQDGKREAWRTNVLRGELWPEVYGRGGINLL